MALIGLIVLLLLTTIDGFSLILSLGLGSIISVVIIAKFFPQGHFRSWDPFVGSGFLQLLNLHTFCIQASLNILYYVRNLQPFLAPCQRVILGVQGSCKDQRTLSIVESWSLNPPKQVLGRPFERGVWVPVGPLGRLLSRSCLLSRSFLIDVLSSHREEVIKN